MRLLACLLLVGCGGGSDVEGDPLVQSALTARFAGVPWTPMYGFARMETASSFVLFIGDSKISCADDFEGVPRNGTYAAFGLSGAPTTGASSTSPANFVQVVDNDPNTQIVPGSVILTAVGETDVTATVEFDANALHVLEGTVTMLRCP